MVKAAAYASGSPIKVVGVIEHDCTEKFWVQAKVTTITYKRFCFFHPVTNLPTEIEIEIPVELTFPAQCFNENSNETSTRAVYNQTSNETLENLMTDFFDKSLPIEWQRATDDNGKPGEFSTFKTTNHLMYVTYKYPLHLNEVYETTIHIGSSYAKGISVEEDIVFKAWTPFDESVLSPKRVGDGVVFTYWKNCTSIQCSSLGDFLSRDIPDARCNEFSDLFKAIVQNQGISGVKEITFRPPLNPSNMFQVDVTNEFGPNAINEVVLFSNVVRFAVKNWETYLANENNHIFQLNNIPMNCEADWAKGDIGIPGQGNVVDPVSLHGNHIALTYGPILYDPSYGYDKVADRAIYEDDNLDTVSGLIFEYDNLYYYWIGQLNEVGVADTRE